MPLPSLVLPWHAGDDPARLREREWLVTNGLGGFASGTLLGVPTRRHHGVFVPNLAAPRGRHVVVPRLDDLFACGAGEANLGGAEYADGRIEHDAQRFLSEFRLDGTMPVWRFDIDGSIVEKSVVMPHGRNAVCVRWRLLRGPARRMTLRLYIDTRRQDAALAAGASSTCGLEPAGDGAWRVQACGVPLRMRLLPACPFGAEPRVDRDVLLRVERDRGYDHCEEMYSPGGWSFELQAGDAAAFIASSGDAALPDNADALFDTERQRQRALLVQARALDDEVEQRLVLACDAFIVQPAARRDDAADAALRTVIAGYHWFNDWGRDTMIALEGLALGTGRHDEARAILRTFAGYVRDGLLPNLFAEGDREALYHTVDATLWYFHAIERYLRRSGDGSLLAELYPVLRRIVEQHRRGTRFGIGVDARDGLVHAAADGLQLTWMDAKVDGWVVTPRRGKPVEVQALWHNALRLMASWGRALHDADASGYDALADRVQASFEARYWCPRRAYLLDVVDGPDGDDASLRPNQIFALSLAHPVLRAELRPAVLAAVERHLLTPFGLRTLAPGAPGYRPRYAGNLRERDAAYHQGTVWPWLLGHFIDAWRRVHGGGARALLAALPAHFGEYGVGSIGEVFDAEPPHRAGGCIAQAWSVAEALRAWQATRDDHR